MTELRELSERVELNPDAPRPSFPLFMDLPATWCLLDTNPSSWERSAQTMIYTTFRGSRLGAKERREVMAFFDQLVADCQRAGATLSLIQLGRLNQGGAASLGIHLAFGDEGQPATVEMVRDTLPRNGITREVRSGVGPALLHSERMTMVPPGATELVAMTSVQIFVPIPDTTWTAVFATASAYPELTEPVEQLLTRIVESFRRTAEPVPLPTRVTDGDATPADGADDPDDYVELPRTKAPGIERGFTTLVRKRIEPAQPPGDAAGTADQDEESGQ